MMFCRLFVANVEVCEGSSERSEAVETMVRAGIPPHVVQRAGEVIAALRQRLHTGHSFLPGTEQ